MALSYTQITITDSSKDDTVFSFDFDYINTGDIHAIVSLNPSAATPTWTTILPISSSGDDYDSNGIDATNKRIQLAASPNSSSSAVAGSAIRIYRATTKDAIVDFQGGSRVSEADLDNAYKQGLYAAQEVSENASTKGGAAGALTPNSVDSEHIKDDAVKTSEIENLAVTTAKIANDAVGVDQMADSLNFTTEPTTVILPTANRNLASMDANYIFTGPLRVAAGGTNLTSYANSDVLEKITGVCNGSTVTRHPEAYGAATFTLPNVTAVQNVTTGWAEVTGSLVNIKPPAEATRVEYEFSFTMSKDATSQGLTYFRLMISDESGSNPAEVRSARMTIGGGPEWHGEIVHFKWVIGRYDGSTTWPHADVADDGIVGATTAWDANRKIYLEVMQESTSIPTLARREVGVTSATLTSNVLSVACAADWIDLDSGRTEIVKLDGTWANAVTDPTGYKKATYTYNNAFTIPLIGANQSGYNPGAAAKVYSWVPSDHLADVRLHTLSHFATDGAIYTELPRKPVITITSVK
tara:strand:+ start:23683 stop:25257 length:1575 start_codon:yes stop_codon:yes gene_type:complete